LQTYVDAKENIPRRIRAVLDEEVGLDLEDLKVLHERVKIMQKDKEVGQQGSKKLLNRFENGVELLTSQTTDIKTEVRSVVRRMDNTDTATARNMKRLRKTEEVVQNGGVQLRRDLAELDDKVRRVDARVDRDHTVVPLHPRFRRRSR
jgi:hypothetical protein